MSRGTLRIVLPEGLKLGLSGPSGRPSSNSRESRGMPSASKMSPIAAMLKYER